MKGPCISILAALCFLAVQYAHAQDKKFSRQANLMIRAEGFFNAQEFHDAIPIYEVLEKKGSNTAVRRLGDCYRLMNDMESAAPYYARAVYQENIHPVYFYYHGQGLVSQGFYLEAISWFEKYRDFDPENSMADHMIQSCEYALQRRQPDRRVKLFPISVNTPAAEFGAVFYKEGFVYTSSSNSGVLRRKDSFAAEAFFDLFYMASPASEEPGSSEPLRGDINTTKYHDGPASFNTDGSVIYFSRNNQSAKRNKSGYTELNLKILSANMSNGQFRDPEILPFNGNGYSCAHPSIDREGRKLYFASDLAGGYGGTDIYYSIKDTVTGIWKKPINAGPEVNTYGDEFFPFIHPDGTLYFSSNGHLGYGGLDIFMASPDPLAAFQFAAAQNLGLPFNSPSDDFSFVADADKESGYLSSNRPGGMGGDDIYRFEYNSQGANLHSGQTGK